MFMKGNPLPRDSTFNVDFSRRFHSLVFNTPPPTPRKLGEIPQVVILVWILVPIRPKTPIFSWAHFDRRQHVRQLPPASPFCAYAALPCAHIRAGMPCCSSAPLLCRVSRLWPNVATTTVGSNSSWHLLALTRPRWVALARPRSRAPWFPVLVGAINPP